MNILSFIAVITATIILMFTISTLRKDYNKSIKKWTFYIEIALSWWCFGYAFFYAAADKQEAWFWHRFSAVGWSTFAAFTAMYFIIYTGNEKYVFEKWKKALFFVIPVILLIKNLFGDTTCIVVDLVQSGSGLGWTYVSDATSVWYWFFIIQMMVYFSIAVVALVKYVKEAKYKIRKELAIAFISLDITMLILGIVTDFVLPHFTSYFPPLSVIAIGIFQLGYFSFIFHYDIFNIDNIITPDNIIENSMQPILLLDGVGEILRCNNAACEMFGYEKGEIIGGKFKHYLGNGKYKKEVLEVLNEKKKYSDVNETIRKKNGEKINVIMSISVVDDKRKEFKGIIVSIYDLSEIIDIQKKLHESKEKYKKLSEELYHFSYFDQLTDLPNRRLFYDTLENYSLNFSNNGPKFAIIYMDLDGFKKVNDNYGHKIGDLVLIETARKIKKAVGEENFVARMGGDEFTCIVASENIEEYCEKMKNAIITEFEEKIKADIFELDTGISVGYSIINEKEHTDTLINKADEAMYAQKENKKRD